MTHEVVESPLQSKEQVGVSRLGHVGDCAVGQNQVEADDGVDGEAMLMEYPIGKQPPGTNLRRVGGHPRRPVTQQVQG